MTLSQLADLASTTKRPFPEILSQFPKRVRFAGEAYDDERSAVAKSRVTRQQTPEEVAALIRRVRLRAALRKQRHARRRSPSPPLPSSSATKSEPSPMICSDDEDLESLEQKIRRMETAIKESARAELDLMNQSKKLREARAQLTHRYETMAAQLTEMQEARNVERFQVGYLPPLLMPSSAVKPSQKSSGIYQMGQQLPSHMILSSPHHVQPIISGNTLLFAQRSGAHIVL